MRSASIICAAVAVAVCCWFALGARQAIETSRARVIANHGNGVTTAQEREVNSLVHAARLLNPDKEPEILLGEVVTEHGDFARARRILEAVTHAEPQNLEGWLWLAHASGSISAVFNSALMHIRLLEPKSPLQ